MNNLIIDDMYGFLTAEQLEGLKRYLKLRFDYNKQNSAKKLNVVFDLLHQCDINCLGCGTNATCIRNEKGIINPALSFEEVKLILSRIREYAENKSLDVFINFGGGEPFLRKDILKILQLACEYFGVEGVGIDTNASLLNSIELIKQAAEFVSYIGISINGLHDYHNWWANNPRIDAYNRSIHCVAGLCTDDCYSSKIEVTSVATSININSLPLLMENLYKIGVKKYSVHRAIPVGRMAHLGPQIIPSWEQYVLLLVNLIEKSQIYNISAHLHHSIEGIHASLLCDINTKSDDKMFDTNLRSSIGIETNGDLAIDPWCTVGYWNILRLGNILDPDATIQSILIQSSDRINAIKDCYKMEFRCHGCKRKCSGGSRIVAAASVLNQKKLDISFYDIMQSFKSVDPACPFYDEMENK